MGCADPPSKGVGAPHQCSRVSKKRSGWGEFVTYVCISNIRGAGAFLALLREEVDVRHFQLFRFFCAKVGADCSRGAILAKT